MNVDQLLAALAANAEKTAKPTMVQVDGVGAVYVRPRTVAEAEEVSAALNGAGGKLAPALARLLCDEEGLRLPIEIRDRLVELLGRQPESVFQQIIAGADGTAKDDSAGKLTARQTFIMDLALELGMTVGDLSQRMTERELRKWAIYRNTRLLPLRRIEIYLAQIAHCVARSAGSDATLDAFIINTETERAPQADTAETAAAAISGIVGGSKIVRLGAKKRSRPNG